MRTLGIILMTVGALAALGAFTIDTSVPSYASQLGLPGRTQNLGLMQFQMMVLHTGLAMFIAGAVLLGTASDPRIEQSVTPDANRYERYEEEDQRAERLNKIIIMGGLAAATILTLWYMFKGSS